MEAVSSTQNQGIKECIRLAKARERKKTGLFTIEGEREIRRAAEKAYAFRRVYYCKDKLNENSGRLLHDLSCDNKTEVTNNVYSRIAYRDNSDGLLVVAESGSHNLDILEKKEHPLYLVTETVEKPGNLGALLRTADAAGVDGVIVCDPATDLYNPNVIRSSIGCLFTVPVAICSSEACITFLHDRKVGIFAAALQDSELYTSVDLSKATAVVMGSEAYGLSETWRKAADRIISIPMKGDIDSLNVSVSAAVIIYEVLRQRGEK